MAQQGSTLQAIGALTAQMKAMNDRLDRDRVDRKENDQAARESREKIIESVNSLERVTEKLEASHTDMSDRVAKVESVTTLITSWKARSIGAFYVLSLLGAIIVFAFTSMKEQVIRFLWGS